jgi:hypothetical protein
MLRRLVYVAILACNVVVILMALFPRSARIELRPEAIGIEQGGAYLAGLNFKHSVLFTVPTDGVSSRESSRLVLTENGRPFGPARAPHSVVREMGGGAYSHWRNELWFSASNGSDPRNNGRTYVAESRRDVRPAVLAGLAVLDLIAIWFAPPQPDEGRATSGLAAHSARAFGGYARGHGRPGACSAPLASRPLGTGRPQCRLV